MKTSAVITIKVEGDVNPDFRWDARHSDEPCIPAEDWRLDLAEYLGEVIGGTYPGGPVPPEVPDYIHRAFTGKIEVSVKRDDGVEVTYP